jgi:hypothetical protein
VAPSLHVVELKKAKGDTLEFQNVSLFKILCIDSSIYNRRFSIQTHIYPSRSYKTLSTELKDAVWVCDDEVKDRTSML